MAEVFIGEYSLIPGRRDFAMLIRRDGDPDDELVQNQYGDSLRYRVQQFLDEGNTVTNGFPFGIPTPIPRDRLIDIMQGNAEYLDQIAECVPNASRVKDSKLTQEEKTSLAEAGFGPRVRVIEGEDTAEHN